jgi:hypothetical protein
LDLKAYKTVADIPDKVHLATVATPASTVLPKALRWKRRFWSNSAARQNSGTSSEVLKCPAARAEALLRCSLTEEQRHLDLFILSYVPNVVLGESFNIAVLAIERPSSKSSFIAARFADLKSLPKRDDIDLDSLIAFSDDIKAVLSTSESVDSFLQMMLADFSNTIQITQKKALLLSNPAAEFDQVACLYLWSSQKDSN